MIKGVIFDIDGVILDSMPIWENAGEIFLKKLGIQPEPGLSKALETMSMTEGAEYLKKTYHLNMDEHEIINGVNQTIADFYAHQVQLKDGVEQFLKDIKQHGIKIVAATSCDREVFERAFERLNVTGYFDRIFTCTEIGAGKSKPDIFLAAAGFMGTEPSETLVFEDALYAIQTAKRAGFKTIGVYDDSARDNLEDIKAACDIFLNKLDDFHSLIESLKER